MWELIKLLIIIAVLVVGYIFLVGIFSALGGSRKDRFSDGFAAGYMARKDHDD